jgi:hypothetical protein
MMSILKPSGRGTRSGRPEGRLPVFFAPFILVLVLGLIALLPLREVVSSSPAAEGPAMEVPAIPERQWIPLLYPPEGKGLARMGKHVTPAFCPLTKRVYFIGGDYVGWSYRQELWSLDIAERLRHRGNPEAGWRLEYPYCGPMGAPQPKGPDFVGWTWDAHRNLFWMVPGEMQPHGQHSAPLCPGERADYRGDEDGTQGPKLLYRHIMTFEPVSRTWADYDSNVNGKGSDTWYSVYDPVTDTLIRPSPEYTMGIYDIKKKRWTNYPLGRSALGRDPYIQKSQFATDYEKRRIFMIDPGFGRLHRWDMDSHRFTDLGPIPSGPITGPPDLTIGDKAYAVWDSNARILIHYHYSSQAIFLYHPDESPPRWERGDFPIAPGGIPGLRVYWNGVAFDPLNNVVLAIGVPPETPSPIRDYFFLFRYSSISRPPAPSSKN